MAHNSGNGLVHLLAITSLLIALLGGAKAVVVCGIDSTKLNLCHAAVTGKHPPKPNVKCCAVVRHANLPCLCKYKSILPALGINPTNALALPRKCGLKTPPKCRVA
ncbi:Bifunctional inhibitor/plant lipid transfer protein/seed storage helical domain [Sesbania bispinosa]|nr:Bifunctional inhibitor/plant lipid transfer protein/seed storage helical domain [Sesbania bispinosa]